MKGISSTRFLALAAALLALAFVGTGCGSDDGDSDTSSDPKAEIAALVEESVAFQDPATICEENFSEAALEENFDGKDREARIETCSGESPSELTDLEVTKVEIDGKTAVARVSVQPEGQEETGNLTVELVDEDGWKIDGVR